jgi:penicillin-binding protein 2
MVTALAALDAGITPDLGVRCNGRYKMGNNTWHCHSRRGHGFVDMHTALPKSCDIYFYEYGRQIGIDAIARMARRLGLGEKYELPLPGQAAGIVPDQAWKQKRFKKPWAVGETLNSSIGQGYLALNPLQLAVMTARVASGRAVVPRLLAPADGAPPPQFESLGIPEEHLALVRQGMYDVVNAGIGTARGARSPIGGVHFAGKTGTAQVRRISAEERKRGVKKNESLPWKQRDHALFVAFAPTEQPRYAVSVIIEHGIAGGKYAAPIARDVLTYMYDPERALKLLGPIEDAVRKTREATAREEQQAAAATPETLMPSWLRTDSITPPTYEIGPADEPQVRPDEI